MSLLGEYPVNSEFSHSPIFPRVTHKFIDSLLNTVVLATGLQNPDKGPFFVLSGSSNLSCVSALQSSQVTRCFCGLRLSGPHVLCPPSLSAKALCPLGCPSASSRPFRSLGQSHTQGRSLFCVNIATSGLKANKWCANSVTLDMLFNPFVTLFSHL